MLCYVMMCSLEAGLKAYADSVRKHAQQLETNAAVEPRSIREQNVAAEVSRIAAKCHHKPRPVDGKARFPLKRNRLRCVNENRKKCKRWQAANHGCHCFDRAFLLAGCQRKRLCFLRFSFTQRTQR